MSSTSHGQMVPESLFFTSAFLMTVIFIGSLRMLDVGEIGAAIYRKCSTATSTSQGRTVVFLVGGFCVVLFMISSG
jgi:hypothetical protein